MIEYLCYYAVAISLFTLLLSGLFSYLDHRRRRKNLLALQAERIARRLNTLYSSDITNSKAN